MPNARQFGCSESRNGSIQWPTTRKLTEANADQQWSDDESVANGEEDDADYIDDTRDVSPSYIADDGQALAAAELEWAQLVQLGRERDFVVEDPQDDVILRRALRLLYAERFGQANVAENPSINIEYDQLTPEKAQSVVNNTKTERAAAMTLAAKLGARPKGEPLPNEQTSSQYTSKKVREMLSNTEPPLVDEILRFSSVIVKQLWSLYMSCQSRPVQFCKTLLPRSA